MRRLGLIIEKLVWSCGQVGVVSILRGLARMALLAVRRPAVASVRTQRARLDIRFQYPLQLIPTLVLTGELLEPELALLPEALGAGRVAVDVGASIGTWTMIAARTGASVVACEPDEVNVATLMDNLRRNDLAGDVSIQQVACGSADSTGRLLEGRKRFLNQVEPVDETATGEVLTIRTLSGLADELGLDRIDVLKVNTAGHERDVLRGGWSLFEARRVGLAMFLDGLEVREEIDALKQVKYEVGLYDPELGDLRIVSRAAELDDRPTPMNHYLIARPAAG